ncbi:H-2 class II histocompatibility antigen, A-U alpha chain-like [Carassius gibelio]|uniref:H-2 class II histocompatibility antigen, A-U alpha chain-like n=1 Tax=Carassius gibelio TaxID=101364 RepID=UPI0022785842|nr:H-2 class II histocompatibility antigen, A-U alpha chain-like [Carassius gibelio]
MLGTFCGITFFITYFLYTEGQSYLEYGLIISCSGSAGTNEILFAFNNDVVAYMDFNEKKMVFVAPDFLQTQTILNTYPLDNFNIDFIEVTNFCKDTYFRTLSFNASETLEPPWVSVYPRNNVKLNVRNNLVCLVFGFFPPPVRVSWIKNNVNVTDESTLSRYYPNKDGTVNVFSRLNFIPEEGDIYSCSVEHKALQQPQTRTWVVEIKEPNNGPSVFCGVGLALGLLGLATGVFFIAKGKNWI